MNPSLKVVSIYESNYRDIDSCLEILRRDIKERGADGLVTIWCGKDGIDVRGMGDCDIHDVASYLLAAHAYIAKILLDSYQNVDANRNK